MNIKEVARLLNWRSEDVVDAIENGVVVPDSKARIALRATKDSGQYEILEEDVDRLLAEFEKSSPGRHPPIAVRRNLLIESGYQCAICKSDAPIQFHHILEWSKLKHHDPLHMLAVCGSCHDKIGIGQIDRKGQKDIKARLLRAGPSSNQAQLPALENAETPLDVSDRDRLVWILPRGFLLITDFELNTDVSWCIIAHYYHFGESECRRGTHYHESYRELWETSEGLNKQCRKLGIPNGDSQFADGGFQLIKFARHAQKVIDFRKYAEKAQTRNEPIRFYDRNSPIYMSEIEFEYPKLKGTGPLRDLLVELEQINSLLRPESLVSGVEEAESIKHRVSIEALKFFGIQHPSMKFIDSIINESTSSMNKSAIRTWARRLRRTLSEALDIGQLA